ncbi:apolipoprotein N-acyltransferase [Sulfitobacter donghicola]|uniref:Apolipoprotein N-acyltransferase n=1 Tax=Sulfitobacter donghicola DSW-25 = KCTC 12864 = JCM 14565 TaxID=1300350 RepID=A0A073IEB4_9RHOB|nr:apolipoprotein N-acyltransferase [Sulfitobacter donghicola]KEJ88044.1 apolipoprotein N-acyltransferase [Sulfitobacter donghicola DSW-25 = KCTC 12864 = JCM 14565]KIN68742.1 Apolipoprotein N-acyltransferase [Sulfitobacter donghicola DSW-25 = KCTC 12864 = JCM 14565]
MIKRLKWLALPVVAGMITSLGQAPINLPVLMVLGLAAIIWVTDKRQPSARQAAAIGWAYGFGYFLISLHWIVSPFLVDVAKHGWMAPFALILMGAGGGLFWMLAFWGARRLGPQASWLILTLPLAELLRAYIFTGFPWATFSQGVLDVLWGQSLAVFGPHGVNVMLVVLAAAIAQLTSRNRITGTLLVVGMAMPLIVAVPQRAPKLTDHVVRLVQPNAPQHEKWDPLMIPIFYDRQLAFTSAPATEGMTAPDLILWPETAIPWSLNHSEAILEEISAAAGGTPVALGVQRREERRFYNALVTLGPKGQVTQTYDKHHLVPFGEYMPLGDFAARFGFYGLAPQHGAGFSRGDGAQLLDMGALGRALPLICYEAVFAHDVNAAPDRPNFILHATNDAWFGTYAGPQQHLAQARMRAIEQGLPVARAANTGISAMIGPRGQVLKSLGLNEAGYIDAFLPEPRQPTLYSRTGDLPLALIMVLILLARVLRVAATQRTLFE